MRADATVDCIAVMPGWTEVNESLLWDRMTIQKDYKRANIQIVSWLKLVGLVHKSIRAPACRTSNAQPSSVAAIMGLMSKLKPSKHGSGSSPEAGNSSRPESGVASSTKTLTVDSASQHTSEYTTQTSYSSQPSHPPPGYDEDSYNHWPAVPDADDSQQRTDASNTETKSKPQKKNWFKEKFHLAGPDEKEYYEKWVKGGGDSPKHDKGQGSA